MGSLRTLFAISVVFAHSYGNVFVGGRNAVQLFYMISGFLISYVLVERRAYPNARDFYINRYLRLYPIYFVVAVLTLLAYAAASATGKIIPLFETYNHSPSAANMLLTFSNILIFLQDWVMFAGVENNQLAFSTNFLKSEVVLYPGLLVPQAWTLGVELSFYLIAPFVLTNRRTLIALLVLSVSLRIYLIFIGLGKSDPWTYRFFPTELALFLLGALAHQFLLPIYRQILSKDRIEKYASASTYVLILITLTYWLIPVQALIKNAILFSMFLALMPLTFLFQSKWKWDQWIGDLSYPIYISHILVIFIINYVMEELGANDKIFLSISAVALSVCFSILLNRHIGRPTESLRNRFRTSPGVIKVTDRKAS